MKSKLFAVTLLGLAVATTVALTGCKSEETPTNMETPEGTSVEAPATTSTTEATTTTTEAPVAPEDASTTTNTPETAAPAEQGAEHH